MPKKAKSSKKEPAGEPETKETKEPITLEPVKPPAEFFKIVNDFVGDICTTFPEYVPIISKWWSNKEEDVEKTERVFNHCARVIPERFFDILYQNADMFAETSDVNTEFLPGVVFKYLWSCDISEKTRETIWKYLQLLLFAVINTAKTSTDFGDTAKLFEAINGDELKSKLEETMEHIQQMFTGLSEEGTSASTDSSAGTSSGGIDMNNLPSAENIQEHLQGMMQGKLGKLAMELAEEAAEEFNIDVEGATNADDVFKKMFKNPTKLMGIVKNLGAKVDAKIKSGEVKESELISEGMEMLNKMKSMPGMGNMHDMLNKMGIPIPKGGKMNMNAMDAQMQKNLKMAQMKERMRKKAQSAAPSPSSAHTTTQSPSSNPTISDEALFAIFSKDGGAEKTPRAPKKK
jgi:hypothetical protein